jgi:beta-lactamase class A
MNKKKAIFLSIVVILILTNLITIYLYTNSRNEIKPCEQEPEFKLVSPTIAWKEVDDFLEYQKGLRVTYLDVKPEILDIIDGAKGEYGVYFEDLTTGAWLGVNEKEKFAPISLVKLPLMVAVLKKVEKGEINLEQNVTLKPEYLDSGFGTLYQKGAGYKITIKELLTYLIKESDNTAFYALLDVTSIEEFETTRVAMGLPKINIPEKISPRDYANMLRSLYYSTYLRRTFSEIGLSLMMNTNFESELAAGLPSDVHVAHKVGIDESLGYYHDCGIIYDENPYILCIMSVNTTQEEAARVISSISKKIYEFKHKNVEK